ncbi:MAG TPA: YsnF/AvaK domain-containing protein [Microlunatus sp.]
MSPSDDTTSGAAAVSQPVTMLRSEEQLTVSRTVRVKGAVRLHKRIVTETITQTVKVRREELVITEVASGDVTLQGSPASHDKQLGDREFDLILHEERVVISTAVVPVERVRIRVHVVTDQMHIQETLRREHVDTQKA